jgi:hypothetical protein
MSSSDWITIAGAAVTLISMAVSIVQARSASRSSKTAKAALATVQLAAVAERLKSAQEHIREVAPERIPQRGFKLDKRIDLIRREFDNALSALPKTGAGSEPRKQLVSAQTELNEFCKVQSAESWQKLQILVQDTISGLTAKSLETGESK